MNREAIYFEDLQKDVFIIKVRDGDRDWLEKRQWHQNDYDHNPSDDFDRVRESVSTPMSKADQYDWIASRSHLLAISADTEKWTDRVWIVAT